MSKDKSKGDIGLSVKKNEDFSEWYNQAVIRGELADHSDIKGFMVVKPLGYSLWENFQNILDKEFKKTGVKNVYFPFFIPESLLKKEADHFEGFIPEVAWITHGGNKKLEEKLAARPTSETIMYETFSKWIRSHRDLPLLINQWCSVIRWDTKATKLFLRTREFLWQEGHTVHRTSEKANERVLQMLEIYKSFVQDYLAIPVITGEKSEMEKFPGALITTTIEALMPDGKALQMGTSHHLGDHFAKVFNIKFFDNDEKEKYVWQTSWGVSTRMIGALVMVHGDDKGLIMPPRVAPIKTVIIPVMMEKNEDVVKKAKELQNKLNEQGIFSEVDDRTEYTTGWKFNEWELKGVPLRIEIGPEEIENKEFTLVRRDSGTKIKAKEKDAVRSIRKEMEKMQNDLFKNASNFLKNNIKSAENFQEFKKIKKGFIKAGWCGGGECEEKIKDETSCTLRVIPFKQEKVSKCVYCGKKAEKMAYFSRAY